MKKTLVSLAAASLIVTSAMAADKGIDITTTGQAVVYYQTSQNNGDDNTPGSYDLLDKRASSANVGVQLNLNADLKNNFTFGSQLTYLGTAGLEKNLVSGVRQTADADATQAGNTTTELALTKIFVAKKVANTTVKIGRQELPKSLSPLAFSEGWNVFKNTFDAILVVNTDIPKTTLVGAYVAGGTGMTLGTTGNLTAGGEDVQDAAYMLTVQNKSVPMTTITATYYDLADLGTPGTSASQAIDPVTGIATPVAAVAATHLEGAQAIWLDAKVAGKNLPMGLKLGLQGGSIMPENSVMENTTAYGAKASIKPMKALTLCGAYTYVDGNKDGKPQAAVKNTGTGIKTPLYTQMIANQNAIALDASTFMLKGVYGLGDAGKVIAQGSMTTAGSQNLMNVGGGAKGNDYTDLELIYKVKAGGVSYLAALVNQTWSEKNANNMDSNNIVRVWARYNF